MIKKLLKKALATSPPNENKKYSHLINELKKSVNNIQLKETKSATRSEIEWLNNRKELINKIHTANPLEFLTWKVIKRTMAPAFPQKFIYHELNYLKQQPGWNNDLKNSLSIFSDMSQHFMFISSFAL